MSFYQFNRQEILEKAKKNFSKEKAAQYYLLKEEAIKKKTKNKYKNMTDEEKQAKKECQKNYYQKLKVYKDELLAGKI